MTLDAKPIMRARTLPIAVAPSPEVVVVTSESVENSKIPLAPRARSRSPAIRACPFLPATCFSAVGLGFCAAIFVRSDQEREAIRNPLSIAHFLGFRKGSILYSLGKTCDSPLRCSGRWTFGLQLRLYKPLRKNPVRHREQRDNLSLPRYMPLGQIPPVSHRDQTQKVKFHSRSCPNDALRSIDYRDRRGVLLQQKGDYFFDEQWPSLDAAVISPNPLQCPSSHPA